LKINGKNFNDFLIGKLKLVDFKVVRKDVERFLEDKNELKLLEFNTIKNIIQ
jgi:hypothetical protein